MGIAAFTFASCNKQSLRDGGVSELSSSGGKITVSISSGDFQTKAAHADVKDFQINKFQIFVFDSDGKLETSLYKEITPVQASVNATLATFTGAKTVYALVNHPRLTLKKDYPLSGFEADLTDLRNNSAGNIVMSGKNTLTVKEYDKNKNSGTGPQNLDIFVKRLPAMIVLDKITVDFTGTDLEGASFSAMELYLKNVVGRCHYGLDGLTSSENTGVMPIPLLDADHKNQEYWYNKMTRVSGDDFPAIFDAWTANLTTSGAESTCGRTLFAYPNKESGDSHASTFSPRKTRLVLKAHVTKGDVTGAGGVDTYYVFDLPVLQANTVYTVRNITLTMLGKDNDNNDDDIQAGKITPKITVDEWSGEVGLEYDF